METRMNNQSFDRTNSGVLSKNDRKTDDKHPDIKGQCEIDGVQYWVDGWQKTRNSDGGKFYSLRFKRKDAAAAKPAPRQAPAPQRQTAAPAGDWDDGADVPF